MKKLLLAYILFIAACKHKETMFEEVSSSKSGIYEDDFNWLKALVERCAKNLNRSGWSILIFLVD